MSDINLQELKELLIQIQNDSMETFNRVAAMEIALLRVPEVWKEYRDALQQVKKRAVPRDYAALLDKIR